MFRRGDRGLTLIEIIVSVVILLIICYVIYLIVFNASVNYTNQTRLGDIQDRARRALDEMAREMRQADLTNTQIPSPNHPSVPSIRFRPITGYQKDPSTGQYTFTWGNPVEYVYEDSDIDADSNPATADGRIIRIENNNRRIITDYLKPGGLVFKRSGDDVTIEVTFITADYRNKVLETKLRTAVTLRNESGTFLP